MSQSQKFEVVIDSAKRYADIAAEKTNEIIELSKLKLDKAKLQSKEREQYRKLGKYYFDLVSNTEEQSEESSKENLALIEDCIETIKNLRQDIEWISEQIGTLKPHRICAICGAKNPTSCNFCSSCGKKL
ncbi:MAG: hypothetical protein IKJ47_03175 [Oscillospiraceae bacterium]|nr:hypothetical protein [Oscillospiraceae bacterium]